MSGRTCLITGATRGIGLATAKELARQNYHLAIVCRDATTGVHAVREISAAVPGATIDPLVADLSSQRQVRRIASEVRERYASLNLFVSNAAIVTPQRALTEDGIETQLAVNHLAPFLLTHLLLDLLKVGAPSRIVIVASQVERGGRIDFADLMGEKNYAPLATYSQTKLANVLFTYSLAERLSGSGVTVNCLHPGVVRTRLLNTISEIEQSDLRPANPIAAAVRDSAQAIRSGIRRLLPIPRPDDWAITPEDGAKTTTFVATEPTLSEVSGKYFRECRQSETSPQSHDQAVARRLWEVSESLTGLSA